MAGEGVSLINELRTAGFSPDEVNAWGAQRRTELAQGGFQEHEIDAYFGVKAFDPAPLQKHLTENLNTLRAAEPEKAHTFMDALEAGYGISVSGLIANKQAPAKVVAEDADLATKVVGSMATLAGDFPFMLGGAILGGGGGAPSGPGASVTAVAGAFALPAGMRALLMDSYKNGEFRDFKDWWSRASGIMLETGKAWVTGAATGVAGKVAGAVLPAAVSPTLRTAATVGTELTTMVTVGKALEGEVPSADDFFVAGVALFGAKASVKTAAKLRDIYTKTGVPPRAVAEDAAKDPTILQDLAAEDPIVRAYRQEVLGMETEAPARPAVEAAQQAVLDRVSVGESTKEPWSLAKVYTAVKDDLYPIAKMEKALTEGASLDTAESPYQLARLVRGSAGKATQFLDFGAFDWKTYENTGPGLKQILEPHKADLDGFRAYAVARRAVELAGRDIETGVPLDAAKATVAAGKGYAEAFTKLQDYQGSLVKYLRDSGLVSKEAYDAMLEANRDYVPFHRMIEGGQAGAGAGMRTRNPIKGIKGSERTIIDPIESIIKNTYLYTALAERNGVNAAFGKIVASSPERAAELGVKVVKTQMKPIEVSKEELARQGIDAEAFTIFRPNVMRPAPNQIRYFEGGKPVTFELPPELAEAFNATDRQTAGMLVKIMAVPAKTLRAGSVLAPDFMLRNVVRDQLTAFTFSKNGYIPVWDMMSGAMSIAKQDGAFQNWLKSGGANATMVSIDRQYLQQHIAALDKDAGLMQRSWNVAKSPLEILRIGSELMENATRLGEFKRAMAGEAGTKADIQNAGFESREVTLDFQRIGAQTRSLNMISAFMNAGIEGMDRTVRGFKDAPVATLAKVGAGITLPSVLLWMANHDDPRWKEIPQWERDLFWIVMTKDHIYRIPKPFEIGLIFGSVPERLLDKFAGDNPDAMKNLAKTMLSAFAVNVAPTAAVPIVEQMTNYSAFTGHPLIPRRMEGLLPEYEHHEYSTELSKAMGQLVGTFPGLHDKSIASPIVIDNYIRGWTGSLGVYVEQLLDAGLRKAKVLPDPPKPIATLADIPVVKAFVVRYPSATAQSVQDFYESYADRKKVYDTFQYLVKNGDPDAAMAEAKLAPGAFARMEGIHQSIGALNSTIRLVYKNPDMSPSDKRQLIDSLYGQMIELARAGNEAMADTDKALAGALR